MWLETYLSAVFCNCFDNVTALCHEVVYPIKDAEETLYTALVIMLSSKNM